MIRALSLSLSLSLTLVIVDTLRSVSLVVGRLGLVRAVDGDLQVVGPQPVPVGVGVGEEPALGEGIKFVER